MSPHKLNIVIAVTGLNAVDSPGPGVAVIRSIRECPDFRVKIIGLAYEALEPGIYMQGIADKTYQIPYPSAGTDALLSRLDYINDIEKIDVLIPNFDAELFNFIRLEESLAKRGIRTFLPSMKMFSDRDKINLGKFGKETGLPVPDDIVVSRADEIRKASGKFGYPLVVKGKFYDAYVCNSQEQAEKAFYRLQAKWGVPVIIQEFLSGNEMNIAVLGDGEGNAVSIVPMRKLYITEKGKAWAGVTIEDDVLRDLALRFISATKWRGGCELEVMMTNGNKPFIMEVNPRFPAWIYLTAAAGQNQPAALVKMAMGHEVSKFDHYEVGKVFVRYAWDNIIDISEFHKISGTGEL
ncbi:MAG TPA: ATP-grasp domain-containing protein [Bacteroidales bacterium]|jgi:carbamoyl-phosphate synthase large subunit|nr:ATP-grasp domain-containing protein [Bacteroidales bacterium]